MYLTHATHLTVSKHDLGAGIHFLYLKGSLYR